MDVKQELEDLASSLAELTFSRFCTWGIGALDLYRFLRGPWAATAERVSEGRLLRKLERVMKTLSQSEPTTQRRIIIQRVWISGPYEWFHLIAGPMVALITSHYFMNRDKDRESKWVQDLSGFVNTFAKHVHLSPEELIPRVSALSR